VVADSPVPGNNFIGWVLAEAVVIHVKLIEDGFYCV
jgi:hypothetical protein